MNRLRRLWPIGVLALFILWGWQHQSLVNSVPTYGDVIEITWLLSWFEEALSSGQPLMHYPLAFYPSGWDLGTIGHGPLLIIALLPLQWLGGPAFSYNVAVLLTFPLAFSGTYRLARYEVDQLPATVAALLFSFWGFRWFQTIGHLNVLLGSALLPWTLWAVERALRGRERRWPWQCLAVLCWAISNLGTLYFVWIHGIALGGWLLGRALSGTLPWRRAALNFLAVSSGALLLTAPALLWTWRASRDVGAAFFALGDVDFWSASLNSLPIPYLLHPWLGEFSRTIYHGTPFEQGVVNLGLVAVVVAVVLLLCRWGEARRWLSPLLLTVTGVLLAQGLTLKWDGVILQWPALAPLIDALWSLGHLLKPTLFEATKPPIPYADAIPLPALLLVVLLPFLERARVFARFALIAALGLFLLVAVALDRLSATRYRGLQWLLALLLLVEVIPPPLPSLPFPGAPHPAWEWLAAQPLEGESVVDIVAAHRHTPALYNAGESVWATSFHGQPAVAGASSVWPAENMFLFQWLASHEYALSRPELAPLLRFYGTRYLLLHMRGEWEQELLEEAERSSALHLVACFDPAPKPGPWPHPICVLELAPAPNPEVTLALVEGWSGQEPWGVWADDTTAEALWVKADHLAQKLVVEAFPHCIEGLQQQVTFEVNGERVAGHRWEDCEAWQATIPLPAHLLARGANELQVTSDYALPPADDSGDTRSLSLGFNILKVVPDPSVP